MNDYQDYKSYGSYLSRVFAIIVAFTLLVLAIWFIVGVANDDDPMLGDSSTSTIDRGNNATNTDLFVTGDSNTPANDSDGQTLSTNTDISPSNNNVAGTTTDDLPKTGAELNLVLLIGAFSYLAARFLLPKSV